MKNVLASVCCDRNASGEEQRRKLIKLLREGADIHAADKNGVTALHHAVRFRRVMAVKTLIEHGVNVNQVCWRSGSTALHRAVIGTGAPGTAGKGKAALEIIGLLLGAGAEASIKNKLGRTAADYVADEELARRLRTAKTRRLNKRVGA